MATSGTDDDTSGDDLSLGHLRAAAPALERALARERLFGLGDGPKFGDRYRISKRIGRGGMGEVFQATDVKLDRTVAIKVLSHEASATANSKARLVREALIMARVSNVHVVPVFDVGETDGRVFVAMEYVEGPTLRSWLDEAVRPWKRVLQVMLESARGLAAAHASDVIHRDFKPDNVMLDPDGRARVLDFGLASSTGTPPSDPIDSRTQDMDPAESLTRTGALLGTPAYMAPELFDGQPATVASDQFAFCVTLHEALYGVRPFADEGLLQRRIAGTDVDLSPPPRARDVPRRLRTAMQRGLARDPSERYPSMEQLIRELEQVPTGPGRRWRGVTAGALAVGGMAAAYGWQEYERRSCADADIQLQGVWDAQRRQAVRARLLETGVPYAQATWETVQHELDQYAAQWVTSHVDACTRTNVWHQQSEEMMDLRLACLEDRLASAESLVDVVVEGSDEIVETAATAARSLPQISRCEDGQWLRQRVKPPEDPVIAGTVAELRAELTEIEALRSTAQYEPAFARVQAATERSREVDYAPLVAESLLLQGDLEARLGDYEPARRDQREAFFVARRSGHAEVAAFAAAGLVDTTGEQANFERALDWAEHAGAELATLPADSEAAAFLQTALGDVYHQRGAYPQALRAHVEARDRFESLSGPLSPAVATSLANTAAVLEAQGEYEQAANGLTEALAIYESTLGADHPRAAHAIESLALVHFRQGDYETAATLIRDAIGRLERVLGLDHAGLVNPLNTLGLALRKQGHYDESMRSHQRALAIAEETLGPTHPRVGTVLNNIGTLLAWQERFDEALTYYRRDLEIGLTALGPDHISVAGALNNIGRVLEETKDLDGAFDHYRRSLATKQRAVGEDHPSIATSLYNVGRVLRDQGRGEEALEYFRRSIAVTEAAHFAEHPEIAHTLLEVGHVLVDLGRHAEAAEAYARAGRISAVKEASPALFAAAEFNLARAQWTAGEQTEALTHARVAIVAYAMVVEEDHTEHIANVEAWLAER